MELLGSAGAVSCRALSVNYPVSLDLRNHLHFPRMLNSPYLA